MSHFRTIIFDRSLAENVFFRPRDILFHAYLHEESYESFSTLKYVLSEQESKAKKRKRKNWKE